MIVVANSTPLIYLAAIQRFDLLRRLFGRIVIPQAVYQEVVTEGSGRPGAAETAGADWVEQHLVTDRAKVDALMDHLDSGEAEVIALATQMPADLVVMDEASGRRDLKQERLTFTGTVGVLIMATRLELIPGLRPELDRLRTSGFHLSESIYRLCLEQVGESPA